MAKTYRSKGIPAILLGVLVCFSLASAGCPYVKSQAAGKIPKLSVDIVDDDYKPVDGVTVTVEHHRARFFSDGGETRVKGEPKVVNGHFDYDSPWGEQWVQLTFSKVGYLPASWDSSAGAIFGEPEFIRVILHKVP